MRPLGKVPFQRDIFTLDNHFFFVMAATMPLPVLSGKSAPKFAPGRAPGRACERVAPPLQWLRSSSVNMAESYNGWVPPQFQWLRG